MAKSIVQKLGKWYVNLRGWHTDRKLLIIESDDWGTIRMPSLNAYETLSKKNPLIAKDAFARLDTLANKTDLSRLFEVLTAFRDQHGNHPVITANTIVANPDFDKIQKSGFQTYHYEPFYETIKRQPDGAEVLQLWKEGMEQGVFRPQLHGREHVHALAWLAELRAGNKDLLSAFEYCTWGIPYKAFTKQRRNNLQAALDLYNLPGEEEFQEKSLKNGAKIFTDYFGFKSVTFIPPAYIWHERIIPILSALGVKAVQGISLQYQPRLKGKAGYQKRLHYTGQPARHGIHYLARNVFFEPSAHPQRDWEGETLSGIQRAFDNKQPAIIGSHRINYIGALEEDNRSRNLAMLRSILTQLIKRWPEVEFVSSQELIKIMKE